MTLTKSKYYFEALDNYPYSLPNCLEALNYALSYDPEDADSLCLMGRIYNEILTDYEQAKLYFEEAMQYNMGSLSVPQYYIKCLLDNEDLDEAEKLIEYAMKIKGIDKCRILIQQSLLFEIRLDYKKAIEPLKKARSFAYDQCMIDFLKNREKFVKAKMPKKPKKKVIKKKKETQ
ncbi:tetratricopeptide repeat protein [Chryseobacterium tructae]|uniref:Tetratricopeptide repeat protein n=1 Tax=Chryseobacterium tructae TaxID=1037380 RepID=A0ABV7XQ39_9FLAO|nr:tetratricopeptide repeat protein [Chryseobacterium tructae]MDN3690850.1 tetratricopeptide repeat protein [Chryseobacterium tructae]